MTKDCELYILQSTTYADWRQIITRIYDGNYKLKPKLKVFIGWDYGM